MPTVKAQKVPKKSYKVSPEDIVARFCYHYPQYTFSEAKKIPYVRIAQMMRIADTEHARRMIDLVHVVSSPHTKNGKGVGEVIKYFQDIIDQGNE